MWDWFIWVKSVTFFVRTNGLTTPTEADPEFLVGGSTDLPGAPTYDFAKFSKRLHDIRKIWTEGGGGWTAAPQIR